MKEIKTYFEHKEMAEFFDLPEDALFGDFELLYRPDAQMWMLVGKQFDSKEELEEYAQSQS